MKEKREIAYTDYMSPSGFSEVQWYAALIAVLAVLLIGWTSIMSLIGLNVSLSNVIYLHRYIFVWIFDLIVLALLLLSLYVVNFKRIRLETLTNQVVSLQSQIDNSIVMAGKIGAGQNIEGTYSTQDSELQKTLMKLGRNLMETKEKESQFSWVTRGKEKISDILRAHTKIDELAVEALQGIVSYYESVQGAFFIVDGNELKTLTQYAYNRRRYESTTIKIGYGLIGAAAYERQIIYRTDVPEDYFTITSGLLGEQKPRSILIIPLLQEDEVQGVIELSFFKKRLPQHYISLADELSKVIGATIYNLKINERTAQLLKESQEMTATLKKNEEQLQQNALEMMEAKENVEMTNRELAIKIQEVENGQKRLQALLTNASEFISIYNEDREVTFESPSIRRILGYEPNDTVHGMDEDMMTPKGFRSVTGMFDYLLDTPGGEMTIQYTYLKKNGDKIFLETQGKNLLHDPAIRGLIFNTRDITERIRAEREERMKSRMQSLSENSPDLIIRTSTNGKIVYVNPAASKFLQKDASDLMSMKINELDATMSIVGFIANSLKMLKKTHQKVESELEINVDEEARIVEMRAIPEFGESGDELESVLFQAHDVTQMKRQEELIKEKNKSIQDSINYALRIQRALLPEVQDYQKYFPKTFMMYFPKNTVSGDYPWFYHFDNVYYIAACDCTGHGVPGALLSIIGTLLLNHIVENSHDITAAHLLDKLHAAVRRALKQDDPDRPDNGRDGMELGLVRIDTEKHELQFAGAHRPMYYMRGEEFTEYKGTRKGIGGIPLPGRPEPDFENNVIEYQPGDRFFVFSDGLPDQLDGQKKKKYQAKRFKELLGRTTDQDIQGIYKEVYNDFINVWMRQTPTETEAEIRTRQVDDVLLIGVEL